MPSESELIAKAKRAVLAFGMSKPEADSLVAGVRASAGRRSANASSQRNAINQADRERKRDYDRLKKFIDDARRSDEWKVEEWRTVHPFGVNINDITMLKSFKSFPVSVLSVLLNEGGARIENAFNARVQIARIMNS